jgi:endoglucanase
MKRFIIIAMVMCLSQSIDAALTLKEVRTASNNVLAVYFTSTIVNTNEVSTGDLSLWKLNGQSPTAINKFGTQADPFEHHVYLQVPTLVNGTTYTLQTPHGNSTFVFNDHTIFCESIKTNQNAYSALSKVRYANFAIWLGDGGSKQISGALPAYTVFKQFTNEVVAQGTLAQIGQDGSSGDFVYRIDLAAVPEGGPYKISVAGYGCSYPFGVGAAFSRRLAHVSFRALYHQRCGCPVKAPYAQDIRMKPCHTTIYQTNAPIAEASLVVNGSEPTFTAYGGYHDAGDGDRRTYHMIVPSTMLTTYEAFPDYFTDNQYNIPDKFDANYNIIGKGNGIPDIIDEADWGVMAFEYLQEASGAIHWGTETQGYSPWNTYDNDPNRFGTEVTDTRSAGWGAGIFMHLARIIKPYNPQRSEALRLRAEKAYAAAGTSIRAPHQMYYAVQKYLLTGDSAAHQLVKNLSTQASSYANSYNGACENFANSGWLASFFFSYIIEKTRPTDATVVTRFKDAIKAAADKAVGYLNGNAYPVGTPTSLKWWGSNVAQAQYAYPCIMQWMLTKEQKYIDAASLLMDYIQGLNPIGKCYVTGLGFNRTYNPHDRETSFTKQKGWGPRPGILVFGPGMDGTGTIYPALSTLPRERYFVDNQPSYQFTEFTIYQSLCFPAAVYPVLSQGGSWDETKDPFASQQVVKIQSAEKQATAAPAASIGIAGRALRVSLTLTTAGPVTGELFSLNGRRIVRFNLGMLHKGAHDFSLPLDKLMSSGLDNGVFVCKLQYQGTNISKKMWTLK